MLDYSILDMRTFFTPHEAAMAWCEIIEITKENQHNYSHIYHEITEAISSGQLRAEIPVTYHDSWITRESWSKRHPDRAKIAREDLKRWAEARGQKPKFLFPEMRPEVETEEAITPVKDKKPIQPPLTRENEMHLIIERVCLALWEEYNRWPQAKEVLRELEKEELNPDRPNKYDPHEIIQEITDDTIYWRGEGDNSSPSMGLKTLRNRVSIIKKKHQKQKVKRKIPA